MNYVNTFRELKVYQLSRQLSKEIFLISKKFPREEMYSLTDQIRRSSRSVGAQIAESWARRRYEPHFISKLTDADGEQLETQHWIDTARDCDYITPDLADKLLDDYVYVERMLHAMIDKAPAFCKL